ncbi:PTS sugar transporter subunit IIC [Clostridium sp. BL-8]|uniref:PTS sugar transporter subunit IIC n=1 Tax=Clostridium sp. BL-8 TaxID=349938 RepID=UPI00098C3484|nr:PTS sugar transporter subunit IIC [Clostridium sp. BL-8]OOM80967.1 lichenan permease IIC component [Clostridium sp. BL-8]
MSLGNTLNEKVVPAVMKFVNLKGIQALKDGILFCLPLNIIGSIFLLVACFPSVTVTNLFASMFGADWTEPLFKVQGATMNIMAVVSVIGIAYTYAKNEGHEPLSAGITALVVFIITTPNWTMFVASKDVDPVKVGNVLPIDWTGGKGMIAAIVIGIVVGAIYSWFMKKDIRIKMPEGVPTGVVNAFSAIIPAAVMFIGADVIYIIFKVSGTTMIEWVYKVIQTPLQGLSDSPLGVIGIAFFIPFLWFFGVHGANVVSGIMTGILTANTMDNATLQAAGKLSLANGAHIVTQQFVDNFISMTGSGETIGLVICMLFIAKSAQYKQLGKLSLLPGLFNINEPILFGTPIVMNPIMALPFIFVPVINGLLFYGAIASGILAPMGGLMPPWTTPPIISGFLIGGFKYSIMQIVMLVIATFIYLPFFKKADAMAYAGESAGHDGGIQA